MCHTFSHCVGPTRNHRYATAAYERRGMEYVCSLAGDVWYRVAETLILMGNPLLQGVISTFLSMLVILTMRSFIFVIFFRMMTLVSTNQPPPHT